MPTYDYKCDDGFIFEQFRPYEKRHTATGPGGCIGSQVWVTAPASHIPLWHQSSPKADKETVQMARRAADKSDPVRQLEDGASEDVARNAEQKRRRADESIGASVTAALRQADLRIPE